METKPVCAGLGHQRSLQEETRSISTSGPPGPPQQGPKYSGLREAAQVTMTSSGETKVYVYVIRLLSNTRKHLESLNILIENRDYANVWITNLFWLKYFAVKLKEGFCTIQIMHTF